MAVALIVGLFATTGATVVGLMPVAHWFANRFDVLDRPEERRVHVGVVPRTGGLAMFGGLCMAAVLLAIHVLINGTNRDEVLLLLSIGGAVVLIFATGLLDDFSDTGVGPRLATQIAASLLALFGADLLTSLPLPWTADPYVLPLPLRIILGVLWLAGLTNAINWVDGIDGLASSTGAIICFFLLLLAVIERDAYSMALASVAMGMCVSFFGVNYPPANIFMGDAGSNVIGFLVGVISLMLFSRVAARGEFVAAAMMFLPALVPILDMIRVAVRRIKDGNSPMRADRVHLHHLLLERRSVTWTLLAIGLLNVCTGLIAVLVVSVRT